MFYILVAINESINQSINQYTQVSKNLRKKVNSKQFYDKARHLGLGSGKIHLQSYFSIY